MMYGILLWSAITLGIIIERALYLFGASINKDVFLATMQKCILAGDVAKAVKMCSAANAPLARIVQAGLVKVNRPDEEVQAAMDEAALREIPKLAKRTGFLALLANLCAKYRSRTPAVSLTIWSGSRVIRAPRMNMGTKTAMVPSAA